MHLSFIVVVEKSGKVRGIDVLMQTLLPENGQTHLSDFGIILSPFRVFVLTKVISQLSGSYETKISAK